MANNVKFAVYRGLLANLPASTGQAGVLAWTSDSNELWVDTGSAWQKLANDIAYLPAANQAAMLALSARIGDLCDRTDLHQNFMLTAYPATSAGNWVAISPDASVTGIVGLGSATLHQFVSYVSADGVQHLAQPSFADLSGTLTQAQLPASIGAGSNLTLIDCGTF